MKDILSEDDSNILDSIKTVLSTRIQMDKFLNDLKLGVNITTAIDRLQPLTDVINETIFYQPMISVILKMMKMNWILK